MSASRRAFLVGLSGLPLAACGGGTIGVDPKTIDIVGLITGGVRKACGLLLTVDTVAKLILAEVLPTSLPVEQAAAVIVKDFCDQIAPVIQARSQAGQFRRGVEAATGKIIDDYGPIIVHGKPVPIAVYVQ